MSSRSLTRKTAVRFSDRKLARGIYVLTAAMTLSCTAPVYAADSSDSDAPETAFNKDRDIATREENVQDVPSSNLSAFSKHVPSIVAMGIGTSCTFSSPASRCHGHLVERRFRCIAVAAIGRIDGCSARTRSWRLSTHRCRAQVSDRKKRTAVFRVKERLDIEFPTSIDLLKVTNESRLIGSRRYASVAGKLYFS